MATPGVIPATRISRKEFPEGFIFGGSTSAYQIEGGAKEGGRGESIWDTFTRNHPDKVKGGGNGDIAADSYHLYMDDISHLKDMGLDAYRFSISWPRVLPGGKLSAGKNKEGIDYYNNLINALLANGIQPHVTLFHWDLPQALEDEYRGFLSPKIVNDFRDFAGFCFREFGDRVKNWITINEPWSFSVYGYARGVFPPCHGGVLKEAVKNHRLISTRYDDFPRQFSPSLPMWDFVFPTSMTGNPATEPYIVSHNQLLAHAAAVKLYRSVPQGRNGKIGIALNSHFLEPLHEINPSDHGAAKVGLDFMLGWFMQPLTTGDYPESMKIRVGSRLPKFSCHERESLIKSYDFVGINYYTSTYATFATEPPPKAPSYDTDAGVKYPVIRDGQPIGPTNGSKWLHIYPEGIRKLLVHIKKTYNDPHIYITENGLDEVNQDVRGTVPPNDDIRIEYLRNHLGKINQAIRDPNFPVHVKGYFIWSLLDNFEWADGYTVRFGIIHVDYKNKCKRTQKNSAKWCKSSFGR